MAVDITPPLSEERQLIQSYGDNGFCIAGVNYSGSVLIETEQTHFWPIDIPASITLESLYPITQSIRVKPTGGIVMLLGTGSQPAIVDSGLRLDLQDHRIGLEVMNTGAACRTFNILLAEERSVIAALIAVP